MATEDRTAHRLRALERRTEALESLLLRVWCGVAGAALVAGLLVPYGFDRPADERTGLSVLTTPFVLLGDSDGGGTIDGEGVALAVLFLGGFFGLTLVVLGLLGGLFVVAGRQATERAPKVLRVLLILAAIGSGVVLLFSAMVAGAELGEGGPGGFILLAGVLAYVPLLTAGGRALWVEQPRPIRPIARRSPPSTSSSA